MRFHQHGTSSPYDGRRPSMEITIGKILALLIAIAYLVIGIISEYLSEGYVGFEVLVVAAALVFPLALIWFPDEMGSFTGYVGRGGWIDNETPAVVVSLMGWFFLVGMPVLVYFLSS